MKYTDKEKKKKKQLRNLMVKEVSLVGDPANEGARVVLTKVNDLDEQGNVSDKEFIDDLIKGDDQMAKEDDKKKKEKPKFEGTGVKLSKEDEKKVDEKVEKILHPEKESKETENEEQKENKSSEEPKDLLDASMEENKDNKSNQGQK